MVEDLAGFGRIAEVIAKSVGKAIGTVIEPWQTKRVGRAQADVETYLIEKRAEADAKAAIVAHQSKLEIAELEAGTDDISIRGRAARRLVTQEVLRQSNIEAILYDASKRANDAEQMGCEPRSIADDWINSFLKYAEDVSDAELRRVWAKILSSQATQGAPTVSKATMDAPRLIETDQALMFERAVRLYIAMGQIMDVQPVEGSDIGYYSHMNEATALEDLGLLKRMRDIEPHLDVHGGVLTFWRDALSSVDAGYRVHWTDPKVRHRFLEGVLQVASKQTFDHDGIRHSLRVDRQILTSRGFELAAVIIPGFNDLVMSSRGVSQKDDPEINPNNAILSDFGRTELRQLILEQWADNFSSMGAAVVFNEPTANNLDDARSRVGGIGRSISFEPKRIFNPTAKVWERISESTEQK